MKLIERHIIKRGHRFYEELDDLSWRSKNLYNYSNYLVRQSYINTGRYLNNIDIFHEVKGHDSYKALPAKVSNQVLINLHRNWKSYFQALKAYSQDPSKFLGRPRLPKYKDVNKGRHLITYEAQAISKRALKQGYISLSQTGIKFPTKVDKPLEVRVVPGSQRYTIEVVYEVEQIVNSAIDHTLMAAIDMGVDNLACLTSNKQGFSPRLINGKPIKALNQYFNKTKAKLQSYLKEDRRTSKRINSLSNIRDNKINDYLHNASRYIIDLLVSEGVGVLVIGKNDGWKQEVNIGKRNNQNFVSIPHCKFIEMLRYKAELVGIAVFVNEESYTSKASFLDLDEIPMYEPGVKRSFSGKRVQRAWYKARGGRLIHADVNGSYNILRKVVPSAFSEGIGGVAVRPIRVTPGKGRCW